MSSFPETNGKRDAFVQNREAMTSFCRAIVLVKKQLNSKRLKEKNLGYEWIRLALQLPVDVTHIRQRQPLVYQYRCPRPFGETGEVKVHVYSQSRSNHRTNEIATWYEWKINKNKFSLDQIQSKVDRLRTVRSPSVVS